MAEHAAPYNVAHFLAFADRADMILPMIDAHDRSAWKPQDGRIEFAAPGQHILPDAAFIRKRMARVIDAALNAVLNMLNKIAKNLLIHRISDLTIHYNPCVHGARLL